MKVEVAVLRSPSLISLGFCGCSATLNSGFPSLQELCESRGGRSAPPVPNKPWLLWM